VRFVVLARGIFRGIGAREVGLVRGCEGGKGLGLGGTYVEADCHS